MACSCARSARSASARLAPRRGICDHGVLNRFRSAIAVLTALGALCCGGGPSTRGIDAELAACLPSDTTAAGGIDLARLRASPLYGKLPPGATAFLEPLRSASSLLAAYNGKEALLVARGAFPEAPGGMTLLGKGLAAAGTVEGIRAAAAQRKTGGTGAPWLLDRAAAMAGSSPVWAVVRGGAALPLAGDAANLNQLLRLVDYAAAGIRLDSALRFEAVAQGRDEPSARRFEENLRAMFTLAAATKRGNAPPAAALRSAQVRRDGLTVRVALSIEPEQLDSVLPEKQP
jgi:hypothetical protein